MTAHALEFVLIITCVFVKACNQKCKAHFEHMYGKKSTCLY